MRTDLDSRVMGVLGGKDDVEDLTIDEDGKQVRVSGNQHSTHPHAWTGVSRCPSLQELLSSRFVLDHLSCAVRFRSGHAWYMGKGHDAVVPHPPRIVQ